MAVARRVGLAAYFPRHLNTYQRCPQRYYLEYVRKRPGRVGLDRSALNRGVITHNVLNHAFKHFRRHNGFPAGIETRIRESLSADDYPSPDHWRRDVSAVVDYVELAVESFDTRKSVIAVEQVYGYQLPSQASDLNAPPSFLKARLDLILRRDDGVVEHVDWKTGKSDWTDEIQNVAARITVGKALQERRMVSTVTFLAATPGVVDDQREMTREEVHAGWKTIKGLVSDICTDQEWRPIQSGLCNWCPYYQHGCKLHRARDAVQ